MTTHVAVFEGTSTVGAIDENLAQIRSAASEAVRHGARILVTPELFVTGYEPKRASTIDGASHRAEISAIAKHHNVCIAAATVERTAGKNYILGTVHDPQGEQILEYRKRMLFGREAHWFARGTEPSPIVEIDGVPTSMAICFDVEFPEIVRENALGGADLLLVPTAVPLRAPTNTGPPLLDTVRIPTQMIPIRALESQIAIAYANHAGNGFSGNSVIATPYSPATHVGVGEHIAVTALSRAGLKAARADTPYLHEAQRLA